MLSKKEVVYLFRRNLNRLRKLLSKILPIIHAYGRISYIYRSILQVIFPKTILLTLWSQYNPLFNSIQFLWINHQLAPLEVSIFLQGRYLLLNYSYKVRIKLMEYLLLTTNMNLLQLKINSFNNWPIISLNSLHSIILEPNNSLDILHGAFKLIIGAYLVFPFWFKVEWRILIKFKSMFINLSMKYSSSKLMNLMSNSLRSTRSHC